MTRDVLNPHGWPAEALEVFAKSITATFATLTRRKRPVTWPLTPYLAGDGSSIDVSTGLTYPAKAERARRNPKVALLFEDPVGSGIDPYPIVLVKASAAVKDSDLQAGADRYLREAMTKLPDAYRTTPWFVLARQQWYWTRIWMHLTPLEIFVWPGGDMDAEPRTWRAPDDIAVPPSDPAPPGPPPPPYQAAPGDWRPRARRALEVMRPPVLTVVADGWPIAFPVRGARLTKDGFAFGIPAAAPAPARGPACLTFHTHAERFIGQENAAFVGRVGEQAGEAAFLVERLLGDFSLPGGRLGVTRAFLGKARVLHPRLEAECRRRGQPVPQMHKP